MSAKKQVKDKTTTVILTPADQSAIQELIRAGWATGQTSAIRYALRFAVEQHREKSAA